MKTHKKWRAQICLAVSLTSSLEFPIKLFQGKKHCIGSFDSELKAALARDAKVLELFGPRKLYWISSQYTMSPFLTVLTL